ncbi:MAG: hypothetical protein IIX23_01540 [Oscillospiraceae bacterium]|nr:hypothetical protein [Oscillospiraceae bacterium]
MKNKKLLWLPVVLLLVLAIGVFAACQRGLPDELEPSESQTQPEPTQPEPTETEPVLTEPVATEPEETEPEATEPEETTAPGSSGPNVNTGTGGGYDPGTTEPGTTEPGATEPDTDVTEPAIEVPAAGSEANPYYENIQNGAGEFTTVKIPAGATVYYRIQTAGQFLWVESEDISVTYEEPAQQTRDGRMQLELPADDSEPISLAFTNNSDEDQNFPVQIVGPVGSASNPIEVGALEDISAALEQDDVDGLHYRWIADRDGMLKLWADSSKDVDINLFVDEKAVQLTQDNGGKLCAQVKAEDVLLVQLLAKSDSEGNIPAAEVKLHGYIAQMVDLSVMFVPFEAEPVTVAPGESAYYTITGANGKQLQLAAEKAQIYCGTETLLPDENGVIRLSITQDTQQIEVCNTDTQESTFVVKIHYREGHMLNPQVLEQLGNELIAQTSATDGGHYYSYTAPGAGLVTFQILEAPDNAGAIPKILLSNNTSGATAELTDVEGTVSVQVSAGDCLAICVLVEDDLGAGLDAQLSILGNHFGTEENPIVVEYPGFTADVPAGQTLYYQCFNMNGVLFSLNASDVTVAHNGTEHTGEQIAFPIVSEGRNPAVFAITNTGTEDGEFAGVFTYPVGYAENPAPLILGSNTLTQEAGAGEYYYTFTAPKAGKLTVRFDETAQWVYVVNNLTQGIYGDTQWSDSDPMIPATEITVKKNDVIQISVNTYDKDNVFEAPAGTVEFTAEYVSGPTKITNLNGSTAVSLIPGEYAIYTGQFYGKMLNITGAANTVVYYDGTAYTPESSGRISILFPESGTDDLQIKIHNTGTTNITRSLLFGGTDIGTDSNPDILELGTTNLTREAGSDFYIFTYTAQTRGTLVLTFGGDVDCMYYINNQILGYSNTTATRRVSVREGQTITIAVRTYDPAKPTASPAGTITITATQ